MSTDYYTTIEREGCGHCSRPGPWTDKLLVGLSAAGWRFCFKAHKDGPTLDTLEAWRAFLQGRTITDEYGRVVASDDFWRMVEVKTQWNGSPAQAHRGDGTWSEGPADFCEWLCG